MNTALAYLIHYAETGLMVVGTIICFTLALAVGHLIIAAWREMEEL